LPGPEYYYSAPMQFIFDDPVTKTGRVSISPGTPSRASTQRIVKTEGENLRFSVGDLNGQSGSWITPHGLYNGCPNSNIWIGDDNYPTGGSVGYATILTEIGNYQAAIAVGVADPNDPLWTTDSLSALNAIAALVRLTDPYVAGDDVVARASANPHGGTTYGEISDITAAGPGAEPQMWFPYTVAADLPYYGSGQTLHDQAAPVRGGTQKLSNQEEAFVTVFEMVADPRDVAAGDGRVLHPVSQTLEPACFPLFVYWDPVTVQWLPSLYQPQFLDDGDLSSAKYVVRPGVPSAGSSTGFMTCRANATSHVMTAGFPLQLPNAAVKTTLFVSDKTTAFSGVWGVKSGARPVHDLISTPSLRIEGHGGISIWQLGPGYTGIPATPGDWWVTGYHGNIADGMFLASSASQGHTINHGSGFPIIEVLSLQNTNVAIQWEDPTGLGFNGYVLAGNDLKGYRYVNTAGAGNPAAAPCDSAQGGETLQPIISLPSIGVNTKLWTYDVDTNGIAITAGRFVGDSLTETDVVSTSPGPLFLSLPVDPTMNLYFNWMGNEHEVVPRYELLFG